MEMIVKRIFIIINFVLVCFHVFAENFEQTIHLTANDFKILTENSGESYIYNMSESVTYQKDSLGYCLPILTRNFIIKDCDIITSVDYEVTYTQYKDGIKLGKDLRVSPTTVLDNSFEPNSRSSFIFIDVPSSDIKTVDNIVLSVKDDAPTVFFSISPFRYDEKTKSLDFASDITVYLENNKLNGLWSFEGFQINTGSHNSNSGVIELHDNGVLKIKSKGTVIAPGTVINKGSILEINK